MKCRSLFFLAWAVVASWLAPVAVFAQDFSIDWYSIDGGGGTSTGGVYSVSGTVGQPDAGSMSGGAYTLTGGFWGVLAIQTPGMPELKVTQNGAGTVTISWPQPGTGFVLEKTPSLNGAATIWELVDPGMYQSTGSDWFIAVPAPSGLTVYRLREE